jgi:two-component system sensor histidine kinase/response regulator
MRPTSEGMMTFAGTDRASILVVDDEPANRTLLRAYLDAEYEVHEAVDGAHALGLLARASVDLVLLDVMMPRISGFDVCRMIKETTEDGPYQPVILLTALGTQEDRNHGLSVGADDFLIKPVDRHELLLRIKTFVALRQQDERIRQQLREVNEKDRVICRQLTELRALDSLKDDLVSMMVHDLRNPLSGIKGFLDVFQRAVDDQELHEDAVIALRASERLREILDDMLCLRMLESSAVGLRPELVAADALVRDAVTSMSGAARARQVAISQVLGPSNVTFPGDRKLLLRAIENLLSNALKYSPDGGVVEAVVRWSDSEVEIEVADRGAGIPDHLKRHLFEKFGSIEVARGAVRRGVGLGLYLVRLVAKAHGGHAVVRDREGGGTVFALVLPLAEEGPSHH